MKFSTLALAAFLMLFGVSAKADSKVNPIGLTSTYDNGMSVGVLYDIQTFNLGRSGVSINTGIHLAQNNLSWSQGYLGPQVNVEVLRVFAGASYNPNLRRTNFWVGYKFPIR